MAIQLQDAEERDDAVIPATSDVDPGITPWLALLDALKRYGAGNNPQSQITKPLTRKEAANLLSVSMPTINRMLNADKLQCIRLSPHTVRITRVET